MLQETLGWTVLLLGVVAYAAAWAIPTTRPYAKKFWWVAVALAAVAVGLIVLRRRPGRYDLEGAQEGGKDIQDASMGAIDAIVDKALEEQAKSDAELARNRLHSEQERKEFDAKLDAVSQADDSLERRKALIRLVEAA